MSSVAVESLQALVPWPVTVETFLPLIFEEALCRYVYVCMGRLYRRVQLLRLRSLT